jgi:hypothetical protein
VLVVGLAFPACAIDTTPPTVEEDVGVSELLLTSTSDNDGSIKARVSRADGSVLLDLRWDLMTNQVTVQAQDGPPLSFENAAHAATREGAEVAALYLYRDSLGLRDQPGCDPPAQLLTTVCSSHMCAVHDQCFFDNPDKEHAPCVGSVASFWESAKAWAWGTPSYCDRCNIDAIGETLKNGLYGCQLSGECNEWECGCNAKQCTVDGAPVCLASGDCHELKNQASAGND